MPTTHKAMVVNRCQQGFRYVASFGFVEQESASKTATSYMQTPWHSYRCGKY